MTTIPDEWMPEVLMERIHLHWTAGHHSASDYERTRYHILVEGDGRLVRGKNSIAGNARGSTSPITSHTLNANTGAIGVSLCCMALAKEVPYTPGPAAMTRAQWVASIAVVAQLASRYRILVTPQTILTHAEVETNLRITQENKWDITRLAFDDSIRGFGPIGDRMRREVAAALDIQSGVASTPPQHPALRLPRYKVRGVAPSTLNFRSAPGGEKVGALAEGTRVERLSISDGWWQVRIAPGFVGWVWSSFLVSA